jgi:tRNA U34 2-thiouridine synthase MnmA/TrmU
VTAADGASTDTTGIGTAAASTAAGASLDSQAGQAQQQGSTEQFFVAELAVPLRGVAPGQMFVLYDREVCLGSAVIVAHGPTLAEK